MEQNWLRYIWIFLAGVSAGWFGFWYLNGKQDIVIVRGGGTVVEQKVVTEKKAVPKERKVVVKEQERNQVRLIDGVKMICVYPGNLKIFTNGRAKENYCNSEKLIMSSCNTYDSNEFCKHIKKHGLPDNIIELRKVFRNNDELAKMEVMPMSKLVTVDKKSD